MSVLDIIFLCILLALTFSVYQKGFVKEVFAKLAFIIGGIVAVFFSPYFALNVLTSMISIRNNLLLYIISFLCLFSIVYLVIKIIGSMIGYIFEFPILKSLDRSLGAILGLLEGSIIVCLIIELMLMQSIVPCKDIIASSKIATFFVKYILNQQLYRLL